MKYWTEDEILKLVMEDDGALCHAIKTIDDHDAWTSNFDKDFCADVANWIRNKGSASEKQMAVFRKEYRGKPKIAKYVPFLTKLAKEKTDKQHMLDTSTIRHSV